MERSTWSDYSNSPMDKAMTRQSLESEMDEILNTMAEVYCQLGEFEMSATVSIRTRPMKAGAAYKAALLKTVYLYVEERELLARAGEQELVAQNLPHCGGDMCMSCHFVNDYQKARVSALRQQVKEGEK